MEKISSKYKNALEFFGKEKLNRFENEIQLIQKSNNRTSLQLMGQLLLSPKLLLPYSIMITCFVGYRFYFNESEVPPTKSRPEAAVTYESLDEFVNGATFDFPIAKLELAPSAATASQPAATTEIDPTVMVKKGDTLSTIAQDLLKSSGIKNNYKNRKTIISKLVDLNQQVKNDHYVRAGWKIRSLSLSNAKQLCSN